MNILLLVFFLSGACALAYQIIWIRLFGLIFGGTTLSMSVVIAVFMGGLAIGSHVIGKYAAKVSNRVRLYGILEIVLGIVAAVLFFGIKHLAKLIYVLPFNHGIHTISGIGVRFILSALLLLVPTMIMGGTLPVLLRALTDDKKKIIVNTSLLYAVNTLGAMSGAFVVGVILIRFIGVTGTNMLAAAVNVVMGAIALLVSGRFESTPDPVEKNVSVIHSGGDSRWLWYVVTLGITGFAGLTLEMVWMRMMLLVYNNTTYLYTIVISVYLLGIGLGGFLMRVAVPDRFRTERLFGILLGLTALAALAGFFAFPAITGKAMYSGNELYSTFMRLSVLTAVVFTLIGFVPVLLMGLSFPLGLGLYAREVVGLSQRVGFIYAVNTAGSLFGSLAAVFVLIPTIGITGTMVFCALLFSVPSAYFLATSLGAKKRITVLAASAAALVFFVSLSYSVGIPRSILSRRLMHSEYIEYLREGPSSTIWISSGAPFRKIWVDNLWVSSTSTEGTHALLAHYPLLFHDNPKDICGIAFGTGQTFGTCLLYPIDHITSVEIDAEIIKACKGRFTDENYGILEDPRNTVVIDDGRFFLQGTDQKFDVITAEPLQPYTRGTVNLYSYEFYVACRQALNPGGIVAQWLPVYNSGVDDSWSMIRTFAEAFDYVYLFLNGNDGILLGSQDPMQMDPERQVPGEAIEDMRRVNNGSLYALAANYICSRDDLLKMTADYPVITDDMPSLEFTAPISHWNEDVTAEVEIRKQFVSLTSDNAHIVKGDVNKDRLATYNTSRQLLNKAFYAERTGAVAEAQKLYEQALRGNPADLRARDSIFYFLKKYGLEDKLSMDLRKYFTKPSGE